MARKKEQDDQKGNQQNAVLSSEQKEAAARSAGERIAGAPVQTVVSVGPKDSGPRTYAEARDSAQVDPKKLTMVGNPTDYESAVAAADGS